jgi:hypothetical protein
MKSARVQEAASGGAWHTGGRVDVDRVILIVVGAHLAAEVADRPVAYRLRDRMGAWLRERGREDTVIVCSDVWYLNHGELRQRPTVSVGGPAVNALSAYFGERVPSAFTIEGVLLVQMDLGLTDRVACCWGVSPEATEGAVEAFVGKYLEGFMEAAVGG